MQRWVDDAAAFPRAVPARLRMLLDSPPERIGDGQYFSPPSAELLDRMSADELEPFVNRVSIDSLKPAQRLERGSEAWAYECVAIALAFGERVLESGAGFVSIVLDLDQERSTCVVRFTSRPWHPSVSESQSDELAVAVMTRQS